MELVDLSRRYREFYAPAFSIRVGKSDLTRDLRLAVSQVEADLELGKPARFSFTLTDCFNFKDRVFENDRGQKVLELLKFGTKLDICMGYGDAKSVLWMMTGIVSEITTNFPETGSPELSIAGYDPGFPLTLGKNARTWLNARDSTAVREIASYNNLDAQIETTEEEHAQIVQNHVSDWEFLNKLADRNHFEVYVDAENTLHFAKPSDTASAVLRLAWGEGLLSFKPEANLAGQVAKVEVYGWDRKQKKPIVGVARAGDESGRKGKSAGQQLKRLVRDSSKEPTLRLRLPVFTQAEANQRANAILNERAKRFLTGDAEAIGLPELRPNRSVDLANLGQAFSKPYRIEAANHKIDSSGYRTRFKVSEPTIKETERAR